LSVVGCRLFVVGCWLSVVRCWLSVVGRAGTTHPAPTTRWRVVGCRLLVVGCSLFVVGCWLFVVGCWLRRHGASGAYRALPPVFRPLVGASATPGTIPLGFRNEQ
jgi:hypothetical protein